MTKSEFPWAIPLRYLDDYQLTYSVPVHEPLEKHCPRDRERGLGNGLNCNIKLRQYSTCNGWYAGYVEPCALEGKMASTKQLRDLVKWEASCD